MGGPLTNESVANLKHDSAERLLRVQLQSKKIK